MARKRGFFAELQYQNQLAAKRNEQAARAAHKANVAAHREAERAQQAAQRAAAQRARATATEQKAADREAKRLHEEAMVAEATARNAELAKVHDEIDLILSATLELDDYVDLNTLRTVAEHPPFPREDLEVPISPPAPTVARPEPIYVEPEAPKGLGAVFGGKKKHTELVAQRRRDYEADHRAWQAEVAALPSVQLRETQEHEKQEQQRLAALSEARRQYEADCEQREAAAAETNRRLGVFAGGFNLEAADQVCDRGDLDTDVLDGLASLVDKSLVRTVEGQDDRFFMLETIRTSPQTCSRNPGRGRRPDGRMPSSSMLWR